MYINETVFTPLFRYILWCIEKNGNNGYGQACREIKIFYGTGQTELGDAIHGSSWTFEAGHFSFQRTIRLLEMEKDGEEKMLDFWQKECKTLESETCDRCVFCSKCQSYFWYELGELLFQKTNVMKKEGSYLPVRRIPEKIERHLTPSKKATDLYYYNNRRKRVKIVDGCIVLKGMSSSTPSLMNSIYDTNQYSGGGFYLRYHGISVAIDPGYHFLDNLHHYGLSVLDIHAVVITHEHIDHNNDMRLLDDLHHAVYRYDQNKSKRKIHWYLDKVSYEVANIYQENETGFDVEANVLHCILPKTDGTGFVEDIVIGGDSEFHLKCFPTKHIENRKEDSDFKKHTYGAAGSWKTVWIVMTSCIQK